MEQLYQASNMCRQSFHDWLDRQMHAKEMYHQLLPLVRDIRSEHPGMSSRVMYYLIKPTKIGRDKFISWCNDCGLKLEQKRNPVRTTNSLGVTRFENKIRALVIYRANQVWVSDITYYRIGDRFYYITFIMDNFSKKIVGYHVSRSLQTSHTTIPALQMALKEYASTGTLILHSDGGGQYYSKEFIILTHKAGIVNSMTEDNAENNHAERINGTIKNQYLSYYMPTNFSELKTQLKRAVDNYNNTRPHQSLGKRFPSSVHGLSTKMEVINKEKRSKKERIIKTIIA